MNNLERLGRFGSCHELSVSDSLVGLQVLMAEQFLQTIENITNTTPDNTPLQILDPLT